MTQVEMKKYLFENRGKSRLAALFGFSGQSTFLCTEEKNHNTEILDIQLEWSHQVSYFGGTPVSKTR